ncbi:hypothetical protein MTO96_034499 [Rhipicephalus appendiculatus]
MDTTSTRKRSRPSEPSSDDEGASRKMQAVATERPTVMSPTASSTNVVAEEHSTTQDADITNETEFQLALSKSQKRRQRTSTPQRPVANIGSPPGTAPAATPAVHPSTARGVHGLANPLSATQAAAAGVPAAADTMLPSASPLLDSGTEVRGNTKKNIMAADASTAEWRDRLLATSELAGIHVTARPPADRSQSSGVVQGIDGDYTGRGPLGCRDVRSAGDCRQATRDIIGPTVRCPRPSRTCPPVPHGVRREAIPGLAHFSACGADAMDTSLQLAGDHSDACDAAAIMARMPAAPARPSVYTAVGHIQPTPRNASCGKESGAWPPSRRQLPPTCLIARLKQPCGQTPSGTGAPQLNQAPEKSYAAALGASSGLVLRSDFIDFPQRSSLPTYSGHAVNL